MKLLLLALLVTLGCASGANRQGSVISTLHVTNMTGGFVDVYIDNFWKLYTVTRRTECIKIYERDIFDNRSLHHFSFQPAAEKLFATEPISLRDLYWSIVIRPWPNESSRRHDALTLIPAERCK